MEEKLPEGAEVVRSTDGPEFVVTRTRHLEEALVTHRGLEEALTMDKGNDLIGRRVNDQHRAIHAADLRLRVHLCPHQPTRDEWIVVGSHIGDRSKTRFDDQTRRFDLGGQIHRNGPAKAFAEDDNPIGVDTPLLPEVPPGCSGVAVDPFFVRSPGAAAVSTVVDDEDLRRDSGEFEHETRSLREIPGVAVKPEQHHLGGG